MPKGIPKNKIEDQTIVSGSLAEPKQSTIIEQVAEMLAELQQNFDLKFSELTPRIDELVQRLNAKEAESTAKFAPVPTYPLPAPASQPIISNENSGFIPNKIPSDIEKVVRDLLGDKVEMRIEDSLTLPVFTLHLKIPTELSKEIVQPDIRSKTIKNIEGIDKVKEWVQKVKQNIWTKFNQAGESVPPLR